MTWDEDIYYCEATDQLYLLQELEFAITKTYYVYCDGDMMCMSQSQVDKNMIFICKLN